LSQEIIHTLAQMDPVRLVASSPEAAAILVTGSVRTAGTDVRITTNLIDTASDTYLWSGSLNRKLENIFALQEEVARAIADQLTGILAAGHHPRGSHPPTENLAAYNLY